jgi:hypothetical protein
MTIVGLLIGIALLSIFWPVLRFFIGLAILIVFFSIFTETGNTADVPKSNKQSHTLTYQQLVDYPTDCSKKDSQLAELRKTQNAINFKSDPDDLSDSERAYNSRLKATIWWYSYRCEQ